MTFPTGYSRRFYACMIGCYAAAILACLSIRPLWVDEVLQLIGTRSSPSVQAMLAWTRISVGAAPLGYLTQRPFVLAAGPSAFWARFPSALFSIASCALLIRICLALNLPRATAALAGAIFMIAPSQVRYAMEARPYSEAMFFGLLSVMALAKLAKDANIPAACLAVLALAAGLYTQAYIFFPVCGVAAWYSAAALRTGDRRRALLPLACVIAAGTLFAPWYLLLSQGWRLHIRLSGYPHFHWTAALAMDIFKGISGGTFVCSAGLLLLAAASLAANRAVAGLLLSASLPAILGPVLADSLQDYFFASRQILFAVPALAVLAAMGFAVLLRKSRPAGIAVLALFAVAALIGDVTFQIHAKEDWGAAAKALAQAARPGYCIQPAVELSGAVEMYSVFEPGLASATCISAPSQGRVAFVSNLTMDSSQVEAARAKLRTLGFEETRTITAGGTTIRLEERK